MTDDRKGLARFDAERDVAQDPIFVRRFGNIAVAKPNVAKFDFAARLDERDGVGIGLDGDRLVEKLENALRCSHGGLQDVEFLAEVLNGPEEALGIHCEFDKHADGEGAMKYAITSVPENQSNGGKAQEFHRGVKERVGQDGVAPGKHVVVIAIGKFVLGFCLAIEKLHHAHARDVFLEEGVDAGNGSADAAIGVADVFAENQRDQQDAGQDGESIHSQMGVDFEQQASHDREEKKVVDHGDDTGGKEVVERVDVGGDTGYQAADWVAIEIAHGQALHVAENLAPHVVHGLLAHPLHDANLHILREKIKRQHGQKQQTQPNNPHPSLAFGKGLIHRRDQIAVDRFLENSRGRELERRDHRHQRERQTHAPAVRLHVFQEPPHQVRVVSFA